MEAQVARKRKVWRAFISTLWENSRNGALSLMATIGVCIAFFSFIFITYAIMIFIALAVGKIGEHTGIPSEIASMGFIVFIVQFVSIILLNLEPKYAYQRYSALIFTCYILVIGIIAHYCGLTPMSVTRTPLKYVIHSFFDGCIISFPLDIGIIIVGMITFSVYEHCTRAYADAQKLVL